MPEPRIVFLDFETRCELNISNKTKRLPVSSVYDYARHSSLEVLVTGYALSDGDTVAWRSRYYNDTDGGGLFDGVKAPGDSRAELQPLFDAIPGAHIVAHNAYFERNIWEGHCVPRLGWPAIAPEQWRCTAALSAAFGIPSSLKDAAEFLNLRETKGDTEAMHKLSLPTLAWSAGKPNASKWAGTPSEFIQLAEYCRQDVAVTRALWRVLPKLSEYELDVWRIDQEINLRGMPIDTDLARAGADADGMLIAEVSAELDHISNGKIKSPNERDKIISWLQGLGVRLDDLNRATVERKLSGPLLHPNVRRVLELRLEGSGAAAKKFKAMASRTSPDGRLRGAYRYCGASRTGRWSAEGVQPQNLAKPLKDQTPDVIEAYIPAVKKGDWDAVSLFCQSKRAALAACLRPTIYATPGKTFVAMDYSAIEARLTAWFAKEPKLLKAFADGVDVYLQEAEMVDSENPNRQLGKAAILGLGFGMGEDKFSATCKAWGIDVPESLITRAVRVFRTEHSAICQFWYDLEKAAKTAIWKPGTVVACGALKLRAKRDILAIMLPSKRCLHYHGVRIEGGRITYWGRAKDDETGEIVRLSTWGGKLTENVVQATAACLQRYAIWACARYLPQAPVVMHSHDEVVTEVNEAEAKHVYDMQRAIMLALPTWADGLPMDAKGWIGQRYRKD